MRVRVRVRVRAGARGALLSVLDGADLDLARVVGGLGAALEDATNLTDHIMDFMGEDATNHATDVADLFRVELRVGARARATESG